MLSVGGGDVTSASVLCAERVSCCAGKAPRSPGRPWDGSTVALPHSVGAAALQQQSLESTHNQTWSDLPSEAATVTASGAETHPRSGGGAVTRAACTGLQQHPVVSHGGRLRQGAHGHLRCASRGLSASAYERTYTRVLLVWGLPALHRIIGAVPLDPCWWLHRWLQDGRMSPSSARASTRCVASCAVGTRKPLPAWLPG